MEPNSKAGDLDWPVELSEDGRFARGVELPNGNLAIGVWSPASKTWELGKGPSWGDLDMGRPLTPAEVKALEERTMEPISKPGDLDWPVELSEDGRFAKAVELPNGNFGVGVWSPATKTWEVGKGPSAGDLSMGRPLTPAEVEALEE